LGASWEGYVIERVLQILRPSEAYFWAVNISAELDLLLFFKGERYGMGVMFSEALEISQSMQIALTDLEWNSSGSLVPFQGESQQPHPSPPI
jgi:hypothetical protein